MPAVRITSIFARVILANANLTSSEILANGLTLSEILQQSPAFLGGGREAEEATLHLSKSCK